MFETFLGPAQHHENLTVFPVLAGEPRDLPYLLMAEALALGILTIGEKDGGEVPLLLATNTGRDPVLILDGEQLIGAKQNRMTNRSILLPPETTTEIPVSCMEQGRWHHVSRNFSAAPQHAPSKVRRKAREVERDATDRASRSPSGARPSHRDLAAAQNQVWEEIRVFEGKLGRVSETGAMDAMYDSRRGQMNDWIAAFPRMDGQVGLMAFQEETPLAMDAVGSPTLYAKLHGRILTGYVLDAMEGGTQKNADLPAQHPLSEGAESFLAALVEAQRMPSDSVGSGEYRILTGTILGGELVDEDRLVHVSAFPAHPEHRNRGGSASDGRDGGPIARPTYRRRRYS